MLADEAPYSSAAAPDTPPSSRGAEDENLALRDAYQKLVERLREIKHLEGISNLMTWDAEVMMPKGGAGARGEQLSTLAGVMHERQTSPELGELIARLTPEIRKQTSVFDEFERANIRDAKREYDKEVRVPKALVQQEAELENRGYGVWVEARQKDNFDMFAPILKEWVDLRKKMGHYIDPSKSPYDVCIDRFERGMTAERYEAIFDEVKAGLLPLIGKITQQQKARPELNFDRSFAIRPDEFDVPTQEKLARQISVDLGFDTHRGRLDVSVHPFTGGPHPTDVRMTTRYSANLVEGIMGTIHETGHAMYEQGRGECDPRLADLPACNALSMGVHESQSLLYERMIGQNRNFWKFYWPVVRKHFPSIPPEISSDDFYNALNVVTPSLIRVDADEVTYSLHVILRFEMERELFRENGLAIEELPRVWNEKMRTYLGIEVPSNAMGVLQDVHWSSGLFGYFPSYSIGAMYACQFYNKAKADMPRLEHDIKKGDFRELKEWLNRNVHKQGSRYASGDELCEAVTGERLNPKHFIKYLEEKYGELYKL